ncbi:hypothetical protein E2562_037127 [Oryza meyeriana var. granulata]|uniref:Uncharacterized protein n=1 Tax=Oryza meyeriana var. granulata TaxID=110450 RepID=A0A6G1F250_9ORYZ|nr:hypothetical protein E2562_037127 [Oryza meyeriana var. granulata]
MHVLREFKKYRFYPCFSSGRDPGALAEASRCRHRHSPRRQPPGFVLVGPEGDAFAVRSDSVLGLSRSNSAGETSGISWRAVVCTTTTSHGQDAGARVLPFPGGGPYVVLSKRERGSWRAFLRTVADDGALASLRAFFGTIEVVGGYRELATPDGGEGDGGTWRILLESGQAAEAGSWLTVLHTGGTPRTVPTSSVRTLAKSAVQPEPQLV